MGALALCRALRRHGPHHARLRLLPPVPRQRPIGLGPTADDLGLHGAADRVARRAGGPAGGPAPPLAPARARCRQRRVLVLERAPRPGRSAALPSRAVRLAPPRPASAAPLSPALSGHRVPRRGTRRVRRGEVAPGRGPSPIPAGAHRYRPHLPTPRPRPRRVLPLRDTSHAP